MRKPKTKVLTVRISLHVVSLFHSSPNVTWKVRQRAKELLDLLGDLDRVRAERRKAKANRNKYTGTGNDSLSFSAGGSRYGGFGSDSLGGGSGYSGGDDGKFPRCAEEIEGHLTFLAEYYSGSGSGGGGGSSFRDDARRGGFDEYDAGEYDTGSRPTASSSRPNASPSSRPSRTATNSSTPPAAPAKAAPPPVQEVDLLGGFGDEETVAPSIGKPLPTPNTGVSLDG